LAYYAAELFTKQLSEGENYRDLRPAITICFLGETIFPKCAAPHLKFTLSDRVHQVELNDELQVHTIELPKYTFVKELLKSADDLTRWSFFLREAESLNAEELKQLLLEPAYLKAAEVVEMIARSPEERMRYEAQVKAERDRRWREIAIEEAAKEAAEAAVELARESALKEGREEGLEKGRLVGQIQLLQKILKDPVSLRAELELLTLDKLLQKCEQLQQRYGVSMD
jgi:predicted transposase/invertase (TIGR01784 family)